MDHEDYRQRFCEQRARAKRRRIGWELPYWQWLQIWQDSGHLHDRGTHKGEWVMARFGDKGPYSLDNVRIVRVETNNSEAMRPKKRRPGTSIARALSQAASELPDASRGHSSE